MSRHDNEPDFAAPEQRLKNRRGAEPSAELQSRIMRAVSAELASSSSPTPRIGFLSFAAVMAASLLVACNLAVTLSSATLFDPRPAAARHQTLDDLSAMQQLGPDFPQAEAIRLSLLLHAGEHLSPLPDLRSTSPYQPTSDATSKNERHLQ